MTEISLVDAARQLLTMKNAEESFMGFVRALHPKWDIPHFQEKLITALDLLEQGKLTSGYTN